MENGKIRPRADPKPLNRSTQNLKEVIISARRPPVQNFVQICSLGLLGKWVKYNENFFSDIIIYLFLLTDLQVRLPGGFSRVMARTTRPHARVKPFREPKFEVNIKPMKNPQKSKIRPQSGQIFGQRGSCIKISPINGH